MPNHDSSQIRFSGRQVALMVKAALIFDRAKILEQTALESSQLRAIGEGEEAPCPAVLGYFCLEAAGGEFVWIPPVRPRRLRWRRVARCR